MDTRPKAIYCSTNDKIEVTFEEFKKWLKKFDKNKDGRISQDELWQAIRANGVRFSWWKGRRAVKAIDTNSNGVVDENEFGNLVEFAEKRLGLQIVSY
ncbi:polcalcin Phl p 7-like [Olea europaea subsp. europaea]|uniref:Polcalcin Phl p 7-like n=1 Tax=Olea europaea subsp. europaea TaxID=158383 RepID=A0A8S0PLI1_OLEEU|nr:polcalcin Phl p 7-like [Olea europaea subsp. europaea]